MTIYFVLSLSLILPIVSLIFTGHEGAAQKLARVLFVVLVLGIFWQLLKEKKK